MKETWVQWFEIPVYYFDKAKAFYETIFQIDLYIMDLGAVTMGIFPGNGLTGAICHGEWYHPSPNGVMLHIPAGNDLTDVLNRVEGAGGAIVQPKKQISTELGYMALIEDCEGNRIVLRSPN